MPDTAMSETITQELKEIRNGVATWPHDLPEDPEIYSELQETRQAIKKRMELTPEATAKDRLAADEEICIKTRTLVATFDSSTAWGGSVDPIGRGLIELLLRCAREVMVLEADCPVRIREARQHCWDGEKAT